MALASFVRAAPPQMDNTKNAFRAILPSPLENIRIVQENMSARQDVVFCAMVEEGAKSLQYRQSAPNDVLQPCAKVVYIR